MHYLKRFILWTGCLITVGGIWLVCYFQVGHDRNQAQVSAETNACNFAKAFEEQVVSTVVQIDSTLLTMRDDYVQHPKYFKEQLAIFKKNLYHRLIIQVSVIDADGIMVFNEQTMPKVPLDLSDREHFSFHRNSDKDVLFISKPVLGRVSGRWSIQFTRKIIHQDGTFGGVMVISVDPEFFSSYFRSFELGQNGLVVLVGMDRVIRARSVKVKHLSDTKEQTLPPDRPFFDLDKPAAGIYRMHGAMDGIARFWAYRRLQNYPLAVTVGLAEDEVFSPANSRKHVLVLWAVIVSTGLLIGTRFILYFDRQQSRIELSLREAKQRLELATASGHLGIWEWDVSAGALAWDARMHELYGFAPGTFSGRYLDFLKALHPDDLAGAQEAIQAALRGEKNFSTEFRAVHPDGTVKVIKADGVVIRDAAGSAVRMIGLNCDKTELKQMEKALHDSEEQFRTLCDAAPIGIFRSDSEGDTIYCNPRWEEITGISASEGLGKPWTLGSHPDDIEELGRAWREAVAKGHIFSRELRQLTPQGKTIWVRALASPLLRPDGSVLSHVGTLEDITDLRQARHDMLKTQKLESLGVLAGGIAHDFNNILTAIFGNISLARFQMHDTETVARRLDEAEHAIGRAADLTKQLLTFARGGAPVKKFIEVNQLLREAALFALHGSKASCEFDLADDMWPLEVDEGQVAQVIHNLVLNADQAMPTGGTVTIGAQKNSSPSKGERFVTISVTDTGMGIPENDLQKIFDPYFTTKSHGNGLGLATCYSIIRKHGGTISVASTEGKGSMFVISLPASEQEYVSEQKTPARLFRGSGRVLVMDDDEGIRAIAQGMLQELGYTAEVAADGAGAVDLYLKRKNEGLPFSAVILDMTIPGGMGGKETMRKLLEIDPEVKAVVSSGYSNDTVMANFRDHGFREVLNKPYLPQEMSRVLMELTRQ